MKLRMTIPARRLVTVAVARLVRLFFILGEPKMIALGRKIGVRNAFDLRVNLEILIMLVCRIFLGTADIKSRIRRQHVKTPISKMLPDKFSDILLGLPLTPCSGNNHHTT